VTGRGRSRPHSIPGRLSTRSTEGQRDSERQRTGSGSGTRRAAARSPDTTCTRGRTRPRRAPRSVHHDGAHPERAHLSATSSNSTPRTSGVTHNAGTRSRLVARRRAGHGKRSARATQTSTQTSTWPPVGGRELRQPPSGKNLEKDPWGARGGATYKGRLRRCSGAARGACGVSGDRTGTESTPLIPGGGSTNEINRRTARQ
jgi:hypothetical protein